MLVYHGTTVENALSIKNRIQKPSHSSVWNVSKKDCMYFWINPEQDDTLSDTDRQNQCLIRALEAGQIAAAVKRTMESDLAIITYDIDPEEANDFPDLSCAHMDGALEIPFAYIDFSKLNFYKVTDVMIPELSLFYLLNLDEKMLHLDNPMRHRLHLVKNACSNQDGSIFDEIFYMAWEKSLEDMEPLS